MRKTNSDNQKSIYIMGLSSCQQLAKSVAKNLKVNLVPITSNRFADGEIMVRPEITVRNHVVTIIQSLSKPVNESLMELLIAIDAVKRASAKEINVVIPYYGYARQDRKTLGREPITSKLVARLLETAGASRVSVIDVHSEQTQGFFEIPVDTLRANFLVVGAALKELNTSEKKNLVIVSPDYGGVKRARNVANSLNCPLAILDKRRPVPNQAEIVNVLGDVKNKVCLINDDMIDTAGTIVAACKVLKEKGAKKIIISATHGILSGPAIERLTNALKAKTISDIYLTNSIATVNQINDPHFHVIDLGKYLSDVIKVYYSDKGSISTVYDEYSLNKFRI